MTDPERLDWLERHFAEVRPFRVLPASRPDERVWLVTAEGRQLSGAPTLREAIDRAAKASTRRDDGD